MRSMQMFTTQGIVRRSNLAVYRINRRCSSLQRTRKADLVLVDREVHGRGGFGHRTT